MNNNDDALLRLYESSRQDFQLASDVLNFISLILSTVSLLKLCKRPAMRHFPHNVDAFICASLVVLHFGRLGTFLMRILYRDDDDDTSESREFFCVASKVLLHVGTSALFYTYSCSLVVVYHAVVKKTPVVKIRGFRTRYYAVMIAAITTLTLLPVIRGDYYSHQGKTCWLSTAHELYLYSSIQAIGTMILLLFLGIPVILTLSKATSEYNRLQAGPARRVVMLRDVAIRQVLIGFVMALFSIIIFLNEIDFELKSVTISYVRKTLYTLVALSWISFGSIGLLISLCYALNIDSLKSCFKSKQDAFAYQRNIGSIPFYVENDGISSSTFPQRLDNSNFRSYYDSEAQSGVSVLPPDDDDDSDNQESSQDQFTKDLLTYVKQQLEIDGMVITRSEIDAFVSEYESSSDEEEDDLEDVRRNKSFSKKQQKSIDNRLCIAKERWLEKYYCT